jgi:hypothetical protein
VSHGVAGRLILLAALYTGLNALKPLQMDDTAYAYFAHHMALAPLDPYGFDVFWYDEPMPANEVLAPPVLPYWWALSQIIVGDLPWAWKAALFPWSLLLIFSLYGLFHRLCLGLEEKFTWATVLSATLLPSLNLMLDVPALALSLAAINYYLRAADRNSMFLAAFAGLAAGAAVQTKYTGLLAPGVIFLYALLYRRWSCWLAASLIAAQVFVTWELLTALLYGSSHFLTALGNGTSWTAKLANLPFLATYLGGLTPPLTLVAMAALGFSRKWMMGMALFSLAGFTVAALWDHPFPLPDYSPALAGKMQVDEVRIQPAEPIFHVFFAMFVLAVIAVSRRLLAGDKASERRATVFLLLWLGLEIVGFMALTPFPAGRRVLGLVVVCSLLIGRLATNANKGVRPLPGLNPALATSVLLGIFYFGLDWEGAWVQKCAAETAAIQCDNSQANWFVGHWGFQFYAERAGLRPWVASGEMTGDRLVVPGPWLSQQPIDIPQQRLELAETVEIPARLPMRTVPNFYGGRVPLEPQPGPALTLRIYRLVR